MIRSFADRRTEAIYKQEIPQGVPSDVVSRALRKLILIDNAMAIADLRVPPGNRLEKLVGDRAGQYSIRVNEQWRICFVWGDDNNAYSVEFTDYHS